MGQDVRARRLQKADRVNCAKARSDRIELCPESATRYTGSIGAWLSLVERLVRDQEAGGSNPLAPTISFNNLQVVAGQTAHPTAHPVVKLRPHPFVPILRAWRRTQPRIPPRRRLLPSDPPLQAP